MLRSQRRGASLLLALGLVTAATAAEASAPSGTAIAVIQQSEAQGSGGKRMLAPQGPVYSGDRILTGSIGQAQLRFRDGTKLVVGPNSSMIIDAFVFADDNTARQVSVNVVRGALRFMTGGSPKDAYSITTPTATIGVRGTEFDVSVDPTQGGTTRVAVFSGATNTCDKNRRNCVEQVAGCNVTVVAPGEVPRRQGSLSQRQADVARYFRFVQSQRTLLSAFRVDTSDCDPPAVNGSDPSPTVIPIGAPEEPPPPPPPPVVEEEDDHHCDGNCGVGEGNGGGNGTDNEGGGVGPGEDHTDNGNHGRPD
jgi:hypothetical protein